MAKRKVLPIGSISSGTTRPEDVGPALLDALESVDPRRARVVRGAGRFGARGHSVRGDVPWDSEDISEILDVLNEFVPAFCYVGSHPGDAADVGVWPDEELLAGQRRDEVEYASDLTEMEKDRPYVLHINDHGNTTLYRVGRNGQLYEEWACV